MCGIFGFISSDGQGPELARLRRLALITESRGEHAFGLAWLNRDGRFHTFKRPGPARACLDELERCQDALVVIGHCRYATHGSPQDNRNNHPHSAGGGYIVHNGVVHNHRQLIGQYRLRLQSQCDSEVLGLLMARSAGSITQRSAWTAGQVNGELALMGIWRNPARLLVARRGRPLHFGQGADGYYLASLATGLPDRVQEIADNSTRVLVYRDGVLALESPSVELGMGRL